MTDLISRQAAIDAIRAMQTYKLFAGDDQILVDQAEAQTELMMLPSAERKKGKWAGKGDSEGFGIFICGTCGKFAMIKSDFCPNCGADMREEEQDA